MKSCLISGSTHITAFDAVLRQYSVGPVLEVIMIECEKCVIKMESFQHSLVKETFYLFGWDDGSIN